MSEVVLLPLGVRITDMDPRSINADDVMHLRALLSEHGVLVLSNQEMDDADFVTFLGRFGELTFTAGETPVDGFADLNVVSNVGRSTPPRSTFHVDTSYVRRPPAYTALRAVTIPAQGGETLFTNQYRAYETLPGNLRSALEGRTIRHVLGYRSPHDDQENDDDDDDNEAAAEHLIFRPHPMSGRIALYLTTPGRCAGISGMDEAEAEEMIRLLLEHSTQEENLYRHAWSPGDVVMWDNACVLHRADHEGVVGERVMHRGMVEGP